MPQPFDQDSESRFKVEFNADVHLIQVLGEQLIGSEQVGILELIKNAYDAGATVCDVWIEKVPGLPPAEFWDPLVSDLPGPVITITDNGSGMDESAIRDGWLRPATRIKTAVKDRLKREREEADKRGSRDEYERLVSTLKFERGGRLPLGEKGVGRFATNRLGRFLLLQTKTMFEPYEWVLAIDWNEFFAKDDEPRDLANVKLDLIRRQPQRDYGSTNSGTMLRIYGGREGFAWTEEKLRDVGRAISLLRSPDEKRKPLSFSANFHCPQLSDAEFIPLTDTITAPFVCTALVDETGIAEIEIRFEPPQSLSKPIPPQTWIEKVDLRHTPPEDNRKYWKQQPPQSGLRLPECGPFTMDIKLWIRTKEWIDSPDWTEFTAYLEEFGGIGIFKDGLGILPAQIATRNDWLRLSKRHIKRGANISYYQMWGSADVLQEQTPSLVERTSREGMIETRAFNDLSELVRGVILILEFRVKETRDRYNRMKRGEHLSDAEITRKINLARKLLDHISGEYNFSVDPYGLTKTIGGSKDPKETVASISEALDDTRSRVRELREENDGLLAAAGYGIAIAVAVHEIEKIASNLYFGLNRLTEKLGSDNVELSSQSRQLARTTQSLSNELKRIAPLRVTRLESKRKFKVRDCVLAASGAFQLTWEDAGIAFTCSSKSSDFEIDGSFGMCSQVFANLFDNSTYWLRSSTTENKRIRVELDAVSRRVIVADNGPGIAKKMQAHLFELFYSLKNPPSGLGLYICQYYMRQMRGSIRQSFETERISGFTGAHFTLIFPKEISNTNGEYE